MYNTNDEINILFYQACSFLVVITWVFSSPSLIYEKEKLIKFNLDTGKRSSIWVSKFCIWKRGSSKTNCWKNAIRQMYPMVNHAGWARRVQNWVQESKLEQYSS